MTKKRENLQHKMSNIGNIKENYSIKKIDKETVNVRIDNKDLLISILGQFNQNIKSLENLTKTEIFSRGNSITAKGKEGSINKFSEAIKFLANKYFLTKSIDQEDINLSVKAEIDLKNKNNVHSIDQLIKTPKKSVIARSKRQSEYICPRSCRNWKKFFSSFCSHYDAYGKKNRKSNFIKTSSGGRRKIRIFAWRHEGKSRSLFKAFI